MRVIELDLNWWYKGVLARIPLSTTTVLLGPNDSGKSNIIELATFALEEGFGEFFLPEVDLNTVRVNQIGSGEPPLITSLDARAILEFDSPADDAVLADLIQFDDPHPLLRSRILRRQPHVRIRTTPTRFLHGDDSFTLGSKPLDLPLLTRRIRSRLLAVARHRCRDWPVVRRSYATLLDACLGSRRFLLHSGELVWLPPPRESWSSDARKAATELRAHNKLWTGTTVPLFPRFLNALLGGDQLSELGPFEHPWGSEFLRVSAPFSDHALAVRLWDVVQSSDADDYIGVCAGLADFVQRAVEETLPERPWFTETISGNFTVAGPVAALCDRLSRSATEVAPPFVRDRYEIRVRPLPPKRIRVLLRLRRILGGAEELMEFEVDTVGRGIAVWALHAVLEAHRREEAELAALAANQWPRRVVFVFDEPERHLHPLAQEDAAAWIADRTDEGASVLVATHAIPFMAIPRADVQYLKISRNENGWSIAEALGALSLYELARAAPGLGFRPTQILALAKGVLLVEGEHDRELIEHLYAEELATNRIVVQPIRGAQNSLALAQVELLIAMNVPFALLLDRTRLDFVEELAAGRDPQAISQEEGWLKLLAETITKARGAEDLKLHDVGFDLPDIIAAVPDHIVRLAVGDTFPGWDAVLGAHAAESQLPFKDLLADVVGRPNKGRKIAAAIVRAAKHEEPSPPAKPLDDAFQRALKLLVRNDRVIRGVTSGSP